MLSSSILESPRSAFKKCMNGVPKNADARLCCAALLNCVVSCGTTGQPEVQAESFQALRLLLTRLSLEQRETALNYHPTAGDLKVFAGTPLFLAAKLNLPDVARLLMEEGNGARMSLPWDGVTPIEIAMRMNSNAVLAVFEEAIRSLEDRHGWDVAEKAIQRIALDRRVRASSSASATASSSSIVGFVSSAVDSRRQESPTAFAARSRGLVGTSKKADRKSSSSSQQRPKRMRIRIGTSGE